MWLLKFTVCVTAINAKLLTADNDLANINIRYGFSKVRLRNLDFMGFEI
ncbi:MAG: hypothetical protein M9931_01795 [Chitinophagales bacterium]|nr:hypothetical protein [Chitinophagales bacterium]MCO5279770.1 hypothetical protein [Chitinophagales bacterium]HRP40275.1 hypothetical protein [Chitinophagales bacterium]